MFGSKLRSWMEAVRSRKKQHRKEKQLKFTGGVPTQKHNVKWDTTQHDVIREYKENERRDIPSSNMPGQNHPGPSEVSTSGHSRYSANNLSSPESAYSTGYSTDGNSPGAPPENLLNTSKHSEDCSARETVLKDIQNQNSNARTVCPSNLLAPNCTNIVSNHVNRTPIMKVKEIEDPRMVPPSSRFRNTIVAPVSPNLGLISPRQRNRIRTNPWVPSGALSPSPIKQTMVPSRLAGNRDNTGLRKLLGPSASRRRSLSSSSCSSHSGASGQLDALKPHSVSDDDCTLNEMMGKYDESYVYEKETDILSDSDATDCETDIDTGQDGGDEDDPFEGELDFIDNCSYLEFDSRPDHNTGHCSYYNYDVQTKRSSRRRATRRSNKCSERKRRSCSNKKKYSKNERDKHISYVDGSKSAGATPLSVRRANSRPLSKLALQECLRKRSNSIGVYRDQIDTIDKRDKEADMKYRELITEAEHILRAMKTNSLSPRRLPGPANKRVELLRSTECAKPDVFTKNRIPIIEDNTISNSFSKVPSNAHNACPRFSPKKNHITKFIISNSPIMVKKEWEMQNNLYLSPVLHRKPLEDAHQIERNIYTKEKNLEMNRVSPKHRRKFNRSHIVDSSSDSDENVHKHSKIKNKICPQSEPVRRKVYFGANHYIQKGVPFNTENGFMEKIPKNESTENLRQQVLLNTLVSLKKNLEDHSASLKQVYKSSQNIYV